MSTYIALYYDKYSKIQTEYILLDCVTQRGEDGRLIVKYKYFIDISKGEQFIRNTYSAARITSGADILIKVSNHDESAYS
jgi:hypothetical protein